MKCQLPRDNPHCVPVTLMLHLGPQSRKHRLMWLVQSHLSLPDLIHGENNLQIVVLWKSGAGWEPAGWMLRLIPSGACWRVDPCWVVSLPSTCPACVKLTLGVCNETHPPLPKIRIRERERAWTPALHGGGRWSCTSFAFRSRPTTLLFLPLAFWRPRGDQHTTSCIKCN